MVNAVKFDGTIDYLARGGDLTGVADGKTGILSAWVRLDSSDASTQQILFAEGGYFYLTRYGDNKIKVRGYDSASTLLLEISTVATYQASAKWLHILASWDLAAGATHLYILDAADKVTSSAVNGNLDYTRGEWRVAANNGAVTKFSMGLSELYFAPGQYLDFSVTANRRKFIDAAGMPVSLGADGSTPTGTAPAIYLPGGKADFHVNAGSGGNFTLSGSLENASTTPSDPSVNAVDFDGANDYLARGGNLTGVAASKAGTVSFWFKRGDNVVNNNVLSIVSGSTERLHIGFGAGWNGLSISGFDSSGANNFSVVALNTGGVGPSADWHHAMASWDISTGNTTKIHLYIDGVSRAQLYTPTNSNIDYAPATSPNCYICQAVGSNIKYKGAISELYFAPGQYVDLSVQANREKFRTAEGKPASLGADGSTPTGIAPAIYLPNRAAKVGTNAGSGGGLSINGAPKDSLSTPLYYYAEPVKFDGATAYLARGGDLTGLADGKAGTLSFWMRMDGGDGVLVRLLSNIGSGITFQVQRQSNNTVRVLGLNAALTTILNMVSTTSHTASSGWAHILAAWNLATGAGQLYVNNVAALAASPTLTNDNIDYSVTSANWGVGGTSSGGDKLNGALADLWFHPAYLDISQAASRALFIDQGSLRPVPLGAKGELPLAGTQPLLYLGRDYANWAANLGSGGSFA
ncbi:hypothetical protein AZSI13_32200 [Azospira sp. I13]|uniref:LamG-like jellyroll fold domain-containing protein n=1 Tax=Azospira sp. I13 TaxID=1765050 RepID=UPI000D4CEDC9|nr:LamG-like jellyroll fold domain-containing protein [Azospira sp. I13]GBG03893.1 hypothetical protein AZSI13_32200 [Azospira sp. I13]